MLKEASDTEIKQVYYIINAYLQRYIIFYMRNLIIIITKKHIVIIINVSLVVIFFSSLLKLVSIVLTAH